MDSDYLQALLGLKVTLLLNRHYHNYLPRAYLVGEPVLSSGLILVHLIINTRRMLTLGYYQEYHCWNTISASHEDLNMMLEHIKKYGLGVLLKP